MVIDRPEPTALTEKAIATLERLTHDTERAARDWASALAFRGVAPGDAHRYQQAAQVACQRAAHGLRADPPEWLTNWLCSTPHDDAVERRRLTLGYDVLAEPPDWVVEHLRDLPLGTVDASVITVAERLGATESPRSTDDTSPS